MSDFLAQNSEYVRRDYAMKQDVTTALDFQGKVNVPLAIQPTHAVQFSQLDSIKQDVLTELQQQVQNIQLETIKTCKLEFYSESYQATSLGNASLYGCLNFIPLKEDGTRLYCVAWTKYKETNNNYPASPQDFATCWLAEEYGVNSLLSNKRVIADADNLTDADLEYFEQFGGVDNLLPVKVNSYSYASNYYDWNAPPYGFKTNAERVTLVPNAAQASMSWLSGYSAKNTLIFPYENQLFKKIVALQLLPFAISGSYTTNTIYGVPMLYYNKIWNDKYLDTSITFPMISRKHINNRGIYINLPFLKNEAYNEVIYDSTIKDPSISFPTSTYKICIKGFWRDALKDFEFKQYNPDAVMSNVDNLWWKY